MIKNKDAYDLTNTDVDDDGNIVLYEEYWDEDDGEDEDREVIRLPFDYFMQWLESEEE